MLHVTINLKEKNTIRLRLTDEFAAFMQTLVSTNGLIVMEDEDQTHYAFPYESIISIKVVRADVSPK